MTFFVVFENLVMEILALMVMGAHYLTNLSQNTARLLHAEYTLRKGK
jgi:hypothetical protein